MPINSVEQPRLFTNIINKFLLKSPRLSYFLFRLIDRLEKNPSGLTILTNFLFFKTVCIYIYRYFNYVWIFRYI